VNFKGGGGIIINYKLFTVLNNVRLYDDIDELESSKLIKLIKKLN